MAYAAQGFVDQLREQLAVIWKQQFEDRWAQHVHQRFRDRRSEADIRRLRLALDLSRSSHASGQPVPKRAVGDLTPRLAAAYATKTEKTVSRDLNELKRLGLLRVERDGWVPADDAISGLKPPSVDGVLWR